MRFSRHFSSEIFGCVSVQSIFGRLLDAVLHFLPAFSLVKHCCLDFIFTRVLRPYLLNTQHSVGFIGRARESIRCCVLGGWVGWRLVAVTYIVGTGVRPLGSLVRLKGFPFADFSRDLFFVGSLKHLNLEVCSFCLDDFNRTFW